MGRKVSGPRGKLSADIFQNFFTLLLLVFFKKKIKISRFRCNELEEYARKYEDLYSRRLVSNRGGDGGSSTASGMQIHYPQKITF